MKKAYLFVQSLMNGMVPIENKVCVCTSRELAERLREDMFAEELKRYENSRHKHIIPAYSKVVEAHIFESKDEIPFYKCSCIDCNYQKEEWPYDTELETHGLGASDSRMRAGHGTRQ